MREALAGARPERVAVGERPTLASERDHAQMRVGYGLSRAQLIFERLAQRPAPPRAVADAERILAQELQQALSATAAALRGEDRPPAVELPLDAGRAHRERTDAALVQELATAGADDALAVGADRAVLAGEVATSVGGIVTDARVVVGADRFPARAGSMSEGLDRRVEGMLDRLVTVGSSTLSIRSVTFQNSLRLAAGLALALVLGGVFEVENGFWVLFATLSVVRTSAPMTGASAFQAVFGTVIGFAIALPLLLAIGTSEDLYLLVLPIVTVGGLLAGSLNVVWGQAGFTVLVLVLFNLVDPIGWEIGIIRVEDVALGAAVGVLIGLAAWPRGATGQLAQSLADAVEASGSLVAATMERRLRPVSPERLSRLRSRARAKTLRADGVLAVFLTERPKNFEDVAIWEQVSMFAHTRWYGAEMLARQSVARPPPEAADLVEALVERVHELDAAHAAVAAAIARREPPPPVRAPIDVELLDPQSRRLVANPPVDDPWAARGVVDILRTRALLAEITITLIGMRDLVSGLDGPSPEPNRAGFPWPGTSSGQSGGHAATATKLSGSFGGSGCGFSATKSTVVLGGSGCGFRATSLIRARGGSGWGLSATRLIVACGGSGCGLSATSSIVASGGSGCGLSATSLIFASGGSGCGFSATRSTLGWSIGSLPSLRTRPRTRWFGLRSRRRRQHRLGRGRALGRDPEGSNDAPIEARPS